MSKTKILVRGPALTQTGYGEQTRFALRSLRQYEDLFDIYLINTNWGNSNWLWEDNEERAWLDTLIQKFASLPDEQKQFDMSLQVTIPNEWEKLAPVNVGYTAGIETTKISQEWIEKSALMDRIIVVSKHSRDVFLNTKRDFKGPNNEVYEGITCPVPVKHVTYPVRELSVEKIDLELDYDFNFMTSATWGPRKNLANTIAWFVEEFKDEEVGLVVKTNIMKNCIMDRRLAASRLRTMLSKYPDRKCKVYLLHGYLTDEQMKSVYQNKKIKSYISTTHGEGFGLPIFEAAIEKLPVIAPDWSGHTDFLYMPIKQKDGKIKNKAMFSRANYTLRPIQQEAVWNGVLEKDSMWCFVEEASFKMKMRDVYKDYGRFKKQANKLQKWLKETFTEQSQFKRMAELILDAPITSVETKDLPKISIITSVYNGDKFIKPFLEDITRQSIFKEKCELVLINANSPGNEEETIKEYMKKHDNIIYHKLKEDPGIYGAWNKALELSTGEYITNANLDDRKAIDSLEQHAKELYTNPDIDVVYADSFITSAPNETYENNSSSGKRYNFEQFSKQSMLRGNQVHNNPMWRKSLHDQHGLFNPEFKSAGDWEFWLRCASKGSEFKKINKVLGLYYFNPKGISTDFNNFEWKQAEERRVYEKYSEILRQEDE